MKAVPDELSKAPFTLAEARAQGLSRRVLDGPRFRRMFRGVYVHKDDAPDDEPDFATYLAAARLIVGEAPATHVTGLRCHGVSIGPVLPLRFATDRRRDTEHEDIHLIRRMRLGRHANGVLSPEQCWVDACLGLDLVDAVIAADWLIRLGGTTLARLTRFVESTDNWEGIRNARLALPYVREHVESPRETLIRLMFVLAGLPEPQVNRNVYSGDRFIGRADLIWWAYRVVAEYDGRQHAEDVAQWNRDIDRLDDFADDDWAVVHVTGERLRAARTVVRTVHAKLVAGGYTGPEPVFDSRWTRLFERRPAHTR